MVSPSGRSRREMGSSERVYGWHRHVSGESRTVWKWGEIPHVERDESLRVSGGYLAPGSLLEPTRVGALVGRIGLRDENG